MIPTEARGTDPSEGYAFHCGLQHGSVNDERPGARGAKHVPLHLAIVREQVNGERGCPIGRDVERLIEHVDCRDCQNGSEDLLVVQYGIISDLCDEKAGAVDWVQVKAGAEARKAIPLSVR